MLEHVFAPFVVAMKSLFCDDFQVVLFSGLFLNVVAML